ncbi:MAG: primosomal protein N' [Thioalkalispiraceae bacterium]|jgi:primosomal protein N' (replication factor Y)
MILRVAIPTPLRRSFDYLLPDHLGALPLQPGMRVQVPFGRRQVIGVLLETASDSTIPASRLKPVTAVLDEEAVFSDDVLQLLRWASRYYQHPVGDVLQHALPVLLRQGHALQVKGLQLWQLTPEGQQLSAEELKRAPRQWQLIKQLQQAPQGLNAQQLDEQHAGWRAVMKKLVEKHWVSVQEQPLVEQPLANPVTPPAPNPDQQAAIAQITTNLQHYRAFLLEGVTGSGKTEVYLQVIEKVLSQGKQALVLVPEIGLTPQLLQRFRERLGVAIAVLHSGLNDQARLGAWLAARNGDARVVIGTRSALFTPLQAPGVIIIDEEHDASFKQQDGFRYSARDLAVLRAQKNHIPVILGSATPSLESLYNVEQQRYQLLALPQRAGDASPPEIRLIDVRSQKMEHGLSPTLLASMKTHLAEGNQVLLFLNRRGYAPVLMCHDCGWHATCQRCDAHMTYHQRDQRLRCHHCGSERPADKQCPDCAGEDLQGYGQGTERIESALLSLFPDFHTIRIDRDSTRRKHAFDDLLQQVHSGQAQILIGTQMLAKGHHFPNVTLVGILEADQGFYSSDFRGAERISQLILQVAGRAGRADKPGEVLIQTHHPEQALLAYLQQHDYRALAKSLLDERQQAGWPPYSYLALLRAEAPDAGSPMNFLLEAKQQAQQPGAIFLLGPQPAPMEKRAGRFRAQLLVQAPDRLTLQQFLTPWVAALENLKSTRKVRWSIDVDPFDTY